MDDNFLKMFRDLSAKDLPDWLPDPLDSLLKERPLLGCCHGEVRWSSLAQMEQFDPAYEWWDPALCLQTFASDMLGDFCDASYTWITQEESTATVKRLVSCSDWDESFDYTV